MDKKSILRRDVLKRIGAAGAVGTAGLASSSPVSAKEIQEASSSQLDGEEAKQALSNATDDRSVILLSKKLEKKGYRMVKSDSIITEVELESKENVTIVKIPFELSSETKHTDNTYIIWNNRELDPIVHQYVRRDGGKIETIRDPDYIKTLSFSDKSNEKNSREIVENEVENKVKSSSSNLKTSDRAYDCTECETYAVDCDPSLSCLVDFAVIYASYVGCNSCYSVPNFWSCSACVAAVGAKTYQGFYCAEDDCETTRTCIPLDDLPDEVEACSTCININYPNCGL